MDSNETKEQELNKRYGVRENVEDIVSLSSREAVLTNICVNLAGGVASRQNDVIEETLGELLGMLGSDGGETFNDVVTKLTIAYAPYMHEGTEHIDKGWVNQDGKKSDGPDYKQKYSDPEAN